MSNLSELCTELQELRESKEKLESLLDERKKSIRTKMDEIIEAMIDADTPEIIVGEHDFAVKTTTHYSKLGDDRLAESGIEFFDVLRNNGLGYLIKETVNSKSLETAFRNAASENDGTLPEELAAICTQYDISEISVTKASKTARARIKKAQAAKGGAS